jgi:hypothetical protein
MQSTVTPEGLAPEETDPHDIFVIEPRILKEDRVELAARGDKPSANQAPPVKVPASLAEDIMGDILSRPSTPKLRVVPEISVAAPMPAAKPLSPSKPVPPVNTNFRATAATADAIASEIKAPGEINIPGDVRLNGARPSRGAWAKRAAFGFVFALASVAAAEAWDRYGDTAREMLAEWTPALTLPSSQPAATTTAAAPQPAAQPVAPAADTAIADQTPAPPAAAALQPAPAPAAATAAPAPDQTQQLQSMTQDLAAMGQQIEALKAAIAQLKAGQEQMAQQVSRDIVRSAVVRNAEGKASEARTPEHSHSSVLPPRPVPVRKPPRAAYSPAAMNMPPPPPYPASPPRAAAPMPAQPLAETEAPDGGPVVRPPMPLH